ncbi:hemicentin-2 isoform X2 [Betta splendens]|uniref:Hemicentin-2 isoform X2 n=1 Tax=Betta splendens TaxID=158456 RepID=A0A8M1HJM1_BETSP|nr:hemicentin-2 isoform X2 [Betta splendens]
MKCGGLPVAPRELCSRMHICVSTWMLPPMTSHLCFLILSSLVSFQLGLEDVFFSPQDQTVTEGEGVFLQCVSGESSSPASISWFKDGQTVTRGRQIQGEYGGGTQKKTSGTLHLFNVTLEDDGFYICVTHNPLLNITKKSQRAKLTVHGVPRQLQIQQGPNNITVAAGTEVSMNCTVVGFPVPMVHWFKDGCLLTNCSVSFTLQNNGQLLIFRNLSKDHEGLYHCEASNLKKTIKSPTAFLTLAEMDWRFIQQPTDLTVKRGDSARVACRPPYSRPAAQVSWFKDNQLLPRTPGVTVLPGGDLFFHSVQENDSGSYFCRASNIPLQRFLSSRRATLTVLAPPSVTLWPLLVTVPVGAQVELECRVSGHPLPSISWIKRGQSKQTGGKVTTGLRNATLHIQSVRSYDEGAYVCEASNPLGRSRSTATLRVAVSPIIETLAAQVSCRIGASVVLPCRAVGILPITYTWSRAETPSTTTASDRMHTDDGALHISSVQLSHAGEYYCTAENRAGRQQRRTVLTVTADGDEQTGAFLSAKSKSSDSRAERQIMATHAPSPHVEAQHNKAACFSSHCDATTIISTTSAGLRRPLAELKMQTQHQPDSPTHSPDQPLVTQMQPPMLPPPPHPNFQSVDVDRQLPVTISPSPTAPSQTSVVHSDGVNALQYLSSDSQSPSTVTSPQVQHGVIDKLLIQSDSDGSNVTVNNLTQTEMSRSGPVTQLNPSQTQSHQLLTEGHFHDSHREPTPTPSVQKPHQQLSADVSVTPKVYPHRPVTSGFSPKFHLELSVTQQYFPSTQRSPLTEPQLPPVQPSTRPTPPQTQSQSPPTQQPQRSTLPSKIPVNVFPLNATQLDATVESSKPTNDSEVTEWQKRNTSQSPMTSNDPRVTQQSPSWLPVMAKHDIPIVVGVGVSLAFIFITVTFYSVVQKNDPVPTSRAVQRNLGVPVRNAERRTAGRTYENRAFEDDDCVAVIEQSPNTADTRARPPGPSRVTVQMEPTSEDAEDEPALDKHSVTVETYPEPILDTKIDSSLEEEKGCSPSQPSIQLQCAEDWTSTRDDHSPCQDALPPPSSLPSRSPSPSPPFGRLEGLRSSLTLRGTEPCAAPIHHSLSVSHGNPPLLLSHHVSLGLTTVAVDVHLYPASTASMAVATGSRLSSVSSSTTVTAPLFSPPLVNSQENESSARMNQCK